jgi:hypothetical protein
MSTDSPNAGHGSGRLPVHNDVSFEARDVGVSGILRFMLYLGIAIGVSYLICLGVYKLTLSQAARMDAPTLPVRQGVTATLPPEPRLQGVPGHTTDPQQDLRAKVAADRKALEDTRWVDQKAGIAQIPIEDAMKIIAEKGLPNVVAAAPARKK